jgi:hypothetical protein
MITFRRTTRSGWGVVLFWHPDHGGRIRIHFDHVQQPGRFTRYPFISISNFHRSGLEMSAWLYVDKRARLRKVAVRLRCFACPPEDEFVGPTTEHADAKGTDLMPVYRLAQATRKAGGPGEPLADWVQDLGIPAIEATLDFDGTLVDPVAAA